MGSVRLDGLISRLGVPSGTFDPSVTESVPNLQPGAGATAPV